MTNRSSSHTHGVVSKNSTRPKSSMYKRRNKAKARARRLAKLETMKDTHKK